MANDIDRLLQRAGELANAGRAREAERLWVRILEIEPRHSKALFNLGVNTLLKGDFHKARDILGAARDAAPRDLPILMSLSNACRRCDDRKGEREAVDAALAIDAYFLPALLAKATWLQRFGTPAEAATTYGNALKIAPPEPLWPEALRSQLEHARVFVDRWSAAFSNYLVQRLAPLQESLDPTQTRRWVEAISICAGHSKPFNSDSNKMHVPRLPAIPFFDKAEFPSLEALMGKTDVIRGELLALLQSESDRFRPYVAYKPGEPVNQWRELNHSPRWSAFHLWRGGSPVQENRERCPETAKLLADAGMVTIDGLCPNAMFSALAPHTHIPPHNGETNARLVAHLPLVVPDGCRFRVGFEVRRWKVGEVLVFDDTIEHEAFNDSDELRVVLIFDVWNPLLTAAERQMANELATATREFRKCSRA